MPGRLPDDTSLLHRAISGERAALATLLLKHEGALLLYVRRRLPTVVQSIVDPDDIVQETSYEACRMIATFVPQGSDSFLRWLTRIANLRIKAAIQRCRSRRTQPVSAGLEDSASVLSALEQLAIYKRTPSASAAMHEFAANVELAFQRLLPAYREVLQHRYISGLSVEQTASQMQRSSENVYVLCCRAIGALRTQLASASHFT